MSAKTASLPRHRDKRVRKLDERGRFLLLLLLLVLLVLLVLLLVLLFLLLLLLLFWFLQDWRENCKLLSGGDEDAVPYLWDDLIKSRVKDAVPWPLSPLVGLLPVAWLMRAAGRGRKRSSAAADNATDDAAKPQQQAKL
jgi:H+/Cl- antiporter ClcA